MDTNKQMPSDLDAESAILACLILDNNLIPTTALKLKSTEFYDSKNASIFQEMLARFKRKEPAGTAILQHIFKEDRDYIEILGNDTVPHTGNLQYFISKVKSTHLQRKQIELAIKVFNNAHKDNIDNAATIEEIRSCLETQIKDDTGIVEVKSLYAEIDEMYEKGIERGIFPGWHTLSNYYTIRPCEMTIVTGIPSSGKSTFITAMLAKVAAYEEWKFAIYSPENKPTKRYVAQIMQMYVDKPFNRGYTERMTREECEIAREFVDEHFVFIDPKDDELGIDSIITKATVCVIKHGIKGLIIDPWNEIDHSRPAKMNETEYISRCLSRLRHFARNYNVHIWLIAHPTKLQKKPDGTYPVPTPYDISGSSHFRNKADICLCVHRQPHENIVEIHIQKVRFQDVGKIGMIELRYIPTTSNFKEVD